MNQKKHLINTTIILIVLLVILSAVNLPLLESNSSLYTISTVNAFSAHQELQITETNNLNYQLNQEQYFKANSEDGKVNVIIGFTGGAEKRHQNRALIDSFGGDIKRSFTIINAVSARLPVQAVEALSKRHGVRYVEPDYKVSLVSQQVPWGISRVFGSEKYSFPTWSNSRGEGISVAVLDSGVDEGHLDLPELHGGSNTINAAHWGTDVNGHGTHVAGIIAAVDNNLGVVGVSPKIDLYSVKVVDDSGSGSYSNLIEGIEWAHDNNISIINMSLGGPGYSESLKDAVDKAYGGGALLVASAGNGGESMDNVLYPARYNSVIAVSASDSDDNLAYFSSRGPSVELIAPGANILSLYPGNYMAWMNGTSMAAPHVSGAAAVLWGSDDSLSNVEIRTLLQETAQDLGLDVNHQGFGLVRTDLAVAQTNNITIDLDLSSLIVSEGSLKPSFAPDLTEYVVDVEYDLDSIDVIATLNDENTSLSILGEDVNCGELKNIKLNKTATTTKIDIVVTNEEKQAEKTYNIMVEKTIELNSPVLYWQHETGTLKAWFMDGTKKIDSRIFAEIDEGWEAKGVIATEVENQIMIYFYNRNKGEVVVWVMDGLKKLTELAITNPHPDLETIDTSWDMMAVADLTGNEEYDIIWQKDNGELAVWLMEDKEAVETGRIYNFDGTPYVNGAWRIGAIVDLSGDGQVEVIWHAISGDFEDELAYWQLDLDDPDNFKANKSGRLINVPPDNYTMKSAWRLSTSIDLFDDGIEELIFQGRPAAQFEGELAYWVMEGMQRTSSARLDGIGTEWKLVGSSN